MGASGAGKTSLLNVLSDRIGVKPGDELTGEI
jgi:ABC-type lipoprotein export system ATPase subunit